MSEADTIIRLLQDLERGRSAALDELFAAVYDELRAIARVQRRRWPGAETLNTTALVHELYLKLGGRRRRGWTSKAHFMAAAAQAIRHILVNHARDQGAQKRGGGWRRTTLDESVVAASPAERLMALDAALGRLAGESERLGRIVECRFFGGMSIEQTAAVLEVSTATVTRGWAAARAWLHRELAHGAEAPVA